MALELDCCHPLHWEPKPTEHLPQLTHLVTPLVRSQNCGRGTQNLPKFAVSISGKETKKKGKIEIEFLSDEDLTRILELLGQDKH